MWVTAIAASFSGINVCNLVGVLNVDQTVDGFYLTFKALSLKLLNYSPIQSHQCSQPILEAAPFFISDYGRVLYFPHYKVKVILRGMLHYVSLFFIYLYIFFYTLQTMLGVIVITLMSLMCKGCWHCVSFFMYC